MAAIGIVGALIVFVLYLGLIALVMVSMWKIFTKANQPGWAIFIPIYNLIIYYRIIQRPKWWLIIYLGGMLAYMGLTAILFMLVMNGDMSSVTLGVFSLINSLIIIALLVLSIMDTHRLSKAFGKGVGFTFGLVFLSFIFIPILAFGDAQYVHGNQNNSIDTGALDSNL